MKNKIIFPNLLLVLLGVSFYIFSAYAQSSPANLSSSLKVNVKSPKSAYILGEVVPFNIELRNEGLSDIHLSGTDAQSGYLKILISNSQAEFKEYTNSAWGNKKQPKKVLEPGQAVMSQATVLSNAKPEISHLNANAAERASKGKIMTGYAFPEAGVYYIKAVLIIPGENLIKIESDPISITINQPVGEDLEVWNKVKNRSDIAYFIQENQFYAPNDEAKENFLQEVRQIIENNPNSQIVSQIKRSVDEFRAREAKRKEFIEKIKQRQKN